ncbi:MAG: biotin/lipoyl-binding protein [Clostridia bacterium]|nr:biotin/lipoyl-binding protein [Clostridia bacterium]
MNRTKASLCVITATIVTVVALFFVSHPEPCLLRTAVITRAPLQQTCMLQGSVTYADVRCLLASSAGCVEDIYVRVGDAVSRGAMLLRLDASAEQQALSQLRAQRYHVRTFMDAALFDASLMSTAAGYFTESESAGAQLLALIESKQIRASDDGIVNNLYVRPGQYVTPGMLLGETRGTEVCLSALWTGDRRCVPKPGMEAYWCGSDGNPAGRLVVESVGIVTETPQLMMQLCFSFIGDTALPRAGDSVPVQLVLDTLPETALLPLEAIDRNGKIWLVRDGRLLCETVSYGYGNNEYIQVPEAFSGERVVLEPDQLSVANGICVRNAEAM